MQEEDYTVVEERIPVNVYHSSERLKDEIGQRILDRTRGNWVFVNLSSKGPFICLTFRQKTA